MSRESIITIKRNWMKERKLKCNHIYIYTPPMNEDITPPNKLYHLLLFPDAHVKLLSLFFGKDNITLEFGFPL